MGADLHVTTRGPYMAQTMVEFLNKYTEEALAKIGAPQHADWYVEDRSVVFSKYSFCHGLDRTLVSSLAHWAAIKVGRKQKSFPDIDGVKRFPVALPYIRYDGFESWPVIPPEHWDLAVGSANQWKTDAVGVAVGYDANQVLAMYYPFLHGKDPEEYQRLLQIFGRAPDGGPKDRAAAEAILEEALLPVRETMEWIDDLWSKHA